MGLISYHRAGVAKRQARVVFGFAQTIAAAVEELGDRHDVLEDLVLEHEATIEVLRGELDELRKRVDGITPSV